MSVAFTFAGGTSLAAAFPSTVGQEYQLQIRDLGLSTPDDLIAAATTTTLTITDVESAHSGRHYAVWVFDWDTSRVLAGTIFSEGSTNEFAQPGSGSPSLSISAFSYDGAGSVSVTVTDPYGYHWALNALDFSNTPVGSTTWVGDGTAQTKTATFTPAGGQDVVFVLENTSNVEDPRAFLFGFADDASTTVTQGDYTWNGGASTPTNDACGGATVLSGTSGSVSANNTGWAGTWPTGADPLFNELTFGGGAPLWWKWTNPTGSRLVFRADITAGSIGSLNAALVKGSCGSQTVDATTCLTVFGVVDSDTSGTTLDLVVDPGETVYLEVDSYTNGATEPPTAGPGDRGTFSFDWFALSATFTDDIDGTPTTLVADLTGGAKAAAEAAAVAGSVLFEVHDTILAGGRVYVAWRLKWDGDPGPDPHDQLWVTEYDLDGSSVAREMLVDAGATVAGIGAPDATSNTKMQLVTDGTLVWASYVTNAVEELACGSFEDASPHTPSATSPRDALSFTVHVWRRGSSVGYPWTEEWTYETVGSQAFNGWQGMRICATTNACWVAVSYAWVARALDSAEMDCNPAHHNRFSCFNTSDNTLTEVFGRYKLAAGSPTGAVAVTTLGEDTYLQNLPHVEDVSDEFFYAGVAPQIFDIVGDGVEDPIIAYVDGVVDGVFDTGGVVAFTDCHGVTHKDYMTSTISSITRTPNVDVLFSNFRTMALISAHSYPAFRGAAGSATIAKPPASYPHETAQTLRMFKSFTNPFTGVVSRLIKTYWIETSGTVQRELINIAKADLTGTVDYLDPADGGAASTVQTVIPESYASSSTGPTQEPFWDGIRDVWQVGEAADSAGQSMWRYDRCVEGWNDPVPARDFDQLDAPQKGGWDNLEFYYANTSAEGRKVGPLVHDGCLCAVGEEPVLGEGRTGLFEY